MLDEKIAVQIDKALKTFGGQGSRLFTPRVNGVGRIPVGAKVAVNHV